MTSPTGFHTDLLAHFKWPFSLYLLSDPDRSQLLLSSSVRFLVPYTDLVLSHQLSSFLQIFPSHFANSFARGPRNHWFQTFLIRDWRVKTCPTMKCGSLTSEGSNCQVSVMYERQNWLFTKVRILYMIV